MISSLLFDFGGTLDSDGQHWLDRFYRIYDQIGLPNIPKTNVKEAFYWADRRMEEDLEVRKMGFRAMMERHVGYQFEKLDLRDPKKEAEAAAAFYVPSERVLRRNRTILEKLHQAGFKLAVVSNFYGNVETLCEEAGLKPILQAIVDSIVVGFRKPDAKIFQLALDRLHAKAPQAAVVGDSFERDMIPAKKIGMTTIWMSSERSSEAPDPFLLDHVIHSLEDLPQVLQAEKRKTLV
jgi:putative hydrolase of the HAD superfamily